MLTGVNLTALTSEGLSGITRIKPALSELTDEGCRHNWRLDSLTHQTNPTIVLKTFSESDMLINFVPRFRKQPIS